MSVKMITLDLDMLKRLRGPMTQTALAEKAGIARATVNRIEQGHAESVTFETLNRIAEALDVDADKLVRFAPRTPQKRKGKGKG